AYGLARSRQGQTARQPRQATGLAHRLASEQRFGARQQIEGHEPDAAAEPRARHRLAEELDQAVSERRYALAVGRAPRGISVERLGSTDVGLAVARLQRVGE